MATKYALETSLALVSGRRSSSAAQEGKLRTMQAKFTTAAADGAAGVILGAIGDVIICGKLPNGSRLQPGSTIFVSATLGAAATIAVGTYRRAADNTFTAISAARYRAAAIVASDAVFANTLALNVFDEQTEDVWIGLVVAAANLANGVNVVVYMPYVSD